MSSGVKRQLFRIGVLGGLLCVAACKKDPGAESREAVGEAGYRIDQPAFFRAAESDDLKALDGMIDSGMEVGTRDATGRTALHAAAGSGAMKAIDFLLDRGVEVDVRDDKGRTPLMEAVERSTPETVRYLLRQGADPRVKDEESYKPLMLAVKEGRSEMVGELAPYVREDLDDALLVAAILGQADAIDELTNFGASIYARLDDGRTALMLAAEKGQAEATEMLLAIGANRFAMDAEGRMAADFAREAGHGELADRLAGEPREGDFELVEPAELGAEMVARVAEETAPSVAMTEADETVAVDETGEEVAVVEDEGGTPWNDPVPGQGGGAFGALPEPRSGDETQVAMLEGAVVGSGEATAPPEGGAAPEAADAAAPIVMRSYRERELPLRVESTSGGSARLRVAGGEEVDVPEGDTIPGSNLRVIRIERRMQSGKNDGGAPTEVSVVAVEDTLSGVERELIVGLPALAHDPVALVEDSASGKYYVARTGQRFRSADGRDFLVGDVRRNQVVIEDLESGETMTLPLRGPRG